MLGTGICSTKCSDGVMGIQTLQSGTFIVSDRDRHPLVYCRKNTAKRNACVRFTYVGRLRGAGLHIGSGRPK
jgi:hypothetical protein